MTIFAALLATREVLNQTKPMDTNNKDLSTLVIESERAGRSNGEQVMFDVFDDDDVGFATRLGGVSNLERCE